MPRHTYIVIFCYMNIFRFYKWRLCSSVRTLIKFSCLNITDNSVFWHNLRKSSAYILVSIYAYNLVFRWNFSKNFTFNAVFKPYNCFLLYCCCKLINSPFVLNHNSVRQLICLISNIRHFLNIWHCNIRNVIMHLNNNIFLCNTAFIDNYFCRIRLNLNNFLRPG